MCFQNRGDGTLFPIDSHGKMEWENYDLIETWKVRIIHPHKKKKRIGGVARVKVKEPTNGQYPKGGSDFVMEDGEVSGGRGVG